jgi:hypothetical protein
MMLCLAAANACDYAEHSLNNCLTPDAVAISAVGCGCAERHVLMLHRTADVVAPAAIRMMTVLFLMLSLYFSSWLWICRPCLDVVP